MKDDIFFKNGEYRSTGANNTVFSFSFVEREENKVLLAAKCIERHLTKLLSLFY